MNEFIKVALRSDSSNLEKGFAAGTAAVNGFKKAVSAAHSVIRSVEDGFKKIGAKSAALGVGLFAAMATSTKAAMNFETQMRNVNSILGMTESGYQALGKQVVNLSKQLPQTAEGLAEGLYNIASSGFAGAEGLEVLNAAGVAATAGMTDTTTAAQGITAVLNAYGMSADQAGDVSDILFKTVDVGVLTFQDLVQQLGDFVPIGEAAGIQFDTMAAAVAALTRNGFPAAQAATALTGVMRAFIKPSTEMTAAVNKLGFESSATMLKQLGLQGALEKLHSTVGDDITAWGQLIQDTEGLRGALSLTSNEGAIFTEALNEITTKSIRAGAAQAAYAEQSKALSAQIQLFKNSITAVRIEIGQYYLPILAHLVALGVSVVTMFSSMPEPLKMIIAYGTVVGTIIAGLGAMLLLSSVRARLFKAALGENSLALRLGVSGATSMTQVVTGLSKTLGTAAKTAAVSGKGLAGVGAAMRQVIVPIGRAADGTLIYSTRMATAAKEGGILSRAANGVTNAARRASMAARGASEATSGWGRATQKVAMTLGKTASAVGKLGGAMTYLRQHTGMMVTGLFLAIDALQSWNATSEEAASNVKGLIDDQAAKHDMKTLKGMSDSYSDLYVQLQHMKDVGPNVGNGFDPNEAGFGLTGDALKGGLENLSPFNDNNTQRSLAEIEKLSKELIKLQAQYDKTAIAVKYMSDLTGLSAEQIQALANSMSIDLLSIHDPTKMVASSMVDMYKAGLITKTQLRSFAGTTGDAAATLLLAAEDADMTTTNLGKLHDQLKTMHDPIANLTGSVIELTDAQKGLQSATRDVNNAQTAFSNFLTAKKAMAQKGVDDQIKSLNDEADARDQARQDASDSAIQAREDELDNYKSGSHARDRAQNDLDAFRKDQEKSLRTQRDNDKKILDQQTEDLQQSVQDQKATLDEQTNTLAQSNYKTAAWQNNLITLTTRLGKGKLGSKGAQEVTQWLAGLGKDGIELVQQMVDGTDQQTQDMADQISQNIKQGGDEAAVELDAGMTIAAQAGAKGAAATRKAILDELGLLPADTTNIMSHFGKSIETGLNQILRGLGQEPIDFGFAPPPSDVEKSYTNDGVKRRARGGIDSQAQITMNPRVLFGERSTGGEAFIPFNGGQRSVDIWAETGRRLGIMAMANGGLINGSHTYQTASYSSKTEKKNIANFLGDMYLSDAEAVLRYARRKTRTESLRG